MFRTNLPILVHHLMLASPCVGGLVMAVITSSFFAYLVSGPGKGIASLNGMHESYRSIPAKDVVLCRISSCSQVARGVSCAAQYCTPSEHTMYFTLARWLQQSQSCRTIDCIDFC